MQNQKLQKQQKLLLVDDIDVNLVAMKRTLAILDAELVCVTSGEQALLETLNNDFAAAIIDVQMPGMDGYELAEHLRSDVRTADMPILFVSANYTEEHHIFRGYSAGAVDFMTKPLKPEVLVGKLRFFLKAHELQEALKTQVRIKESENFLQSILLSFADALIVTDEENRVVIANAAAASLLAESQESLRGKPVRSVLGMPGRGALEELTDQEAQLLTSNHRSRPVRMTVTPLQEHRGQVIVLFDLTSLYESQAKEQALRDELQQAKHFDALGRLAGGVAHDLNNLLTIIQMCGEFIQEDAENPQVVRDEMEKCLDASRRGEALVRNLLTVARKQILKPRSVSVTDALLASQGLVARLLGPAIAVELDLPDEALVVEIDPDRFSQIIMNLSANARDAMPEGGVLQIKARRQCGFKGSLGEKVVVEIRDSGVGIPDRLLDKIFEPFFTTKDTQNGTGLGLAMVHGIVTQSGGTITVSSTEGVGTVFTFGFELSKSQVRPEEVLTEECEPQSETTAEIDAARPESRVLLVEDETNVRRALERILRHGGYTVSSAHDLHSAVALIDEIKSFDVLISDVNLPGPSGVTVAERARSLLNENLPVIFLSGNPGDLFDQCGDELDRTVFIQKPFPPKVLLEEVGKLMNTKAAVADLSVM